MHIYDNNHDNNTKNKTPKLKTQQGRVRTKTVKKASKVIIEKYYTRLTLDFHTNKRICEEVAEIPSKRLRNKIAGYVTHLMKRIEAGPVHGKCWLPCLFIYLYIYLYYTSYDLKDDLHTHYIISYHKLNI